MKYNFFILLFLLAGSIFFSSCPRNNAGFREETDLSSHSWKVFPEKAANWENDTLYLPPVDISRLPVNIPGGGWSYLYRNAEIETSLPASMEQFHSLFDSAGNFDYQGVSWFFTEFYKESKHPDKIYILRFGGTRFRAEVFLNEKLVGYDCIPNTPWEVDVTASLLEGNNRLAVRITDPGGNFSWGDYHLETWGTVLIPPGRGFGGITGNVSLTELPLIRMDKVFIMNSPELKRIKVRTRILGESAGGEVVYRIFRKGGSFPLCSGKKKFSSGETASVELDILMKSARPWSPDDPQLYTLELKWNDNSGSTDMLRENFGFRWFSEGFVEGEKCLLLNNKPVFLFSAISWGFYPGNGSSPSEELAYKQIRTAKEMGLNMLNFHREIGQTAILDQADSQGLLIYEEPGGYRCKPGILFFWDPASRFVKEEELATAWAIRREKLKRMVERDRNHPSLVIYNLINESLGDPDSVNTEDIKMVHSLDPGRFVTYSSNSFDPQFFPSYGGRCPAGDAPAKMYMKPGSDSLFFSGWWDEHHAAGPGVYLDSLYNSPSDFSLNYSIQNEIVFLGEEGGTGVPGNYPSIYRDYEERREKDWAYPAYRLKAENWERFYEEKDLSAFFGSPGNFYRKLGETAFFYHAEMIENCRINGHVDAYVMNGWESIPRENLSGTVDLFRNPKSDPLILHRALQDTVLIMKARNKILAPADSLVMDFYLAGFFSYTGIAKLNLVLKNMAGEVVFHSGDIRLSLSKSLMKSAQLPYCLELDAKALEGKYRAECSLEMDGKSFRDTGEVLFMVLPEIYGRRVRIYEQGDTIRRYLEQRGAAIQTAGNTGSSDLIICDGQGMDDSERLQVLDQVKKGAGLFLSGGAGKFLEELEREGLVEFGGTFRLAESWTGGGYFMTDHPLLEGLPVNCGFNWEYQVFEQYKRRRYAYDIRGEEFIAGAWTGDQDFPLTALGVIPFGKGKIVFSGLDFKSCLADPSPPALTGKRLFNNTILYLSGKGDFKY